MEACLHTDKTFYSKVIDLIHNISPEFAQSPLMAVIPLFESLNADIQYYFD